LPHEAVSAAREVAAQQGVSLSSWVADAMREKAELAQATEILDQLIAESDPITIEEAAWVKAALELAQSADSVTVTPAEAARAA
ncbi:MAG: hypothetical protein ACRDPW_03710, partial [Mycobacteriales bacterium]